MDTLPRIQMSSIFDLITVNPIPQDQDFYDLDTQLASELAARLPEELAQAPLPEIDPDDFERLYGWFLA